MLPARNKRDYDEIPRGAREALEFIWLEHVDEAVKAALGVTAPKGGRMETDSNSDLSLPA
jgi:ATP-dependent Lon protease